MKSTDLFPMDVLKDIKAGIKAQGQTIAVAESVTAGLLQAALASVEEASTFFQGGMTVYNIGQKCRHLDINPIQAIECNCVSAEIAEHMARSVAQRFTADWGIGITGYATPVPESGNEMFAYVAIALRGKAVFSDRLAAGGAPGLDAQLYYINEVLKALKKAISGS